MSQSQVKNNNFQLLTADNDGALTVFKPISSFKISRIADMGEFSSMNSVKSIMKNIPSFMLRGLKVTEHLAKQLRKLNVNVGKEAEIDMIVIFCDGNVLNVIFGECKVIHSNFTGTALKGN